MQKKSVPLATIKRKRDEIKVSLVTLGNVVGLDLRSFVSNDGVSAPTKKGIFLAHKDVEQLVSILSDGTLNESITSFFNGDKIDIS